MKKYHTQKMKKLILSSEISVEGDAKLKSIFHGLSPIINKEVLEFKFIKGDQLIYLKFYSKIVSYRMVKECFQEESEIDGYNNKDKLYIVGNSQYIKDLERTSLNLMALLFGTLTHYVIIDDSRGYWFDVVANSEPEIIIEKA